MFYTKFGSELGWRNVFAIFDGEDCKVVGNYPPSNYDFVHFSLLADEERTRFWGALKEFFNDTQNNK